jgi:16S rRNA G527 N7-methylase RsmG
LKIIRPGIELFLVESNIKKATFLTEVVRELGLVGVRVLVSRYEELSEEIAPLDVVCSRAVGDFKPFLEWASSAAIGSEKVALWIGAQDAAMVSQLGDWTWRDPDAIPHSLRRFILIGARKSRSHEAQT